MGTPNAGSIVKSFPVRASGQDFDIGAMSRFGNAARQRISSV